MHLRERTDDDLAALARVVEALHDSDRYPPHVTGDEIGFVAAKQELWSSVAADDSGVVRGHVSLLDYTARPVMQLASDDRGVDVAELAAVARLFVDPAARGQGVGRALVEAARGQAERRGRTGVLDVWVELPQAIALYESCGWGRAGEVTIEFRSPCTERCSHDGRSIRSFVYVAPRRGSD